MEVDDSRPIWIQLVEDFHRRIASGVWPPGGKIPSVRELALEVGVNPNTVQRALAELDRTELTTTERTSGRFVTADRQVIGQTRQDLAVRATDDYIQSMMGLDLDVDETLRLIAKRWSDRKAEREEGS